MNTIDLDAFLDESGIEFRILEHWVQREWIVPVPSAAHLQLSDVDAARAIFIRDLRRDFGVNDEGVDVVLHLVDQLHGLRRALVEMRAQMQVPPGDVLTSAGDYGPFT